MGITLKTVGEVSAAVTHIYTDERISSSFGPFGADFHNVGQPRMYGVRLRYSFGQ